MKRILIIIPVLILTALTGCLKDKPNVDFSNLGYVAEIATASTSPTFNAPASGLEFFNSASLQFPAGDSIPDTVSFTVNIASPSAPTKDIPITLAIDQTALASYISNPSNVQFQVFPDSTFTFPATTGTVKAGSNNRLDTFYVIFYPWMVSPSASYMLPISITSAPGTTISGNLGTIYFHVVGNPIAGTYNQEWIRYNTATQTGTPAFDEQVGPSVFVPVSPTTISVTSGTGVAYQVSFTNTGGVLSDFTVAFPGTGAGSASAAGITITGGPTVVTADPVNHIFTFNFTYLNSSNAPRNITDKFTP
jgi:Domain of unknown function (DUF1735)